MNTGQESEDGPGQVSPIRPDPNHYRALFRWKGHNHHDSHHNGHYNKTQEETDSSNYVTHSHFPN